MSITTSSQPGSQAADTYEALRALIRDAEYPSGTVLSEHMLAERLGVGRSPVREAVLRLGQEGLLVRMPKRGMVVNTLSAQDIRELYEVREALEVMCVRRAAENTSESLLQALRDNLVEAQHAADAQADWLEYRDIDRRFHATLADAGGNRRASEILRTTFDAAILDPWLEAISAIPNQLYRSACEHEHIINGIAARSPDMAEEAVREHVRSYRRVLAEHLFGAVD